MSAVEVQTIPKQPDIGYAPDWDKYLARTKRRLEAEKANQKELPEGFPKRLISDFVWEGEGLADEYEWTYELNNQQVEEIEAALKHFQGM